MISDDNFIVLSGGAVPPFPPLLPWKGAFVIPDAGDFPGGDGTRIWTPAYGTYDDVKRRQMLSDYRQREYTHFVYQPAGPPYHDDYPTLADDPIRVRHDLIEILQAGFVPVVNACNDQDGGSVTPWPCFVANVDLIPIAFYMWEMNGPLGVAERQPDGSYTGRITDCVRNCYAAAPKIKWYFHFTAGHGAPGYPEERQSWVWFNQNFKTAGLLSQDAGYDRNAQTGDPIGTGAGLQDTAIRLGQIGLENVAFEQCTYPTYNHWPGWNEDHQKEYGSELQLLAPNTVGYCDGAEK